MGEATGSDGLQGVVNNAGLGAVGPLEYIGIEELRRIFDVNVFGALAVTQAFLPSIREGGGRIVMIASVVAHLPLPFGSPVSSSKAALEAFSDSLRRELHAWEIPVIQIEPGSIHTPAVGKLKRDVQASLDALPAEGQERYREAVEAMMDKQMAREEDGSDPAEVAEAVEHALSTKRPQRRYPVGADAPPDARREQGPRAGARRGHLPPVRARGAGVTTPSPRSGAARGVARGVAE